MIEGALPSLDDGNAVTVSEGAARMFGWTVGSRHTFQTVSPDRLHEWASNDATLASEDALDGPEIEVEVVAIVRDEYDVADDRFPAIHFPEGFARSHADEIAHLEPIVMIHADPTQVSDIRSRIESILTPVGMDVEEVPPLGEVGDVVVPSVAVEVTALRIATAVAAVAGLFVVAQALGRQLAAAAAEDGVRSALGITSAEQAAGKWLTFAPAALAGAAAVPIVAWAVSGAFPRGLARRAEVEPGMRFDTWAIVAGATATLALALVLLAVMALLASRRRTPAAVIRRSTSTRLLGRPVLSLGASFAADPAGTGRSRLGSLTPVAAIAMGVAAVLAVATLDSSRAHLTSSPRLYGAAAELIYESNGTFGISDVVERALATPGVEALTRRLLINDDTMSATGSSTAEVEPEAFETILGGALPPMSAGRYPAGPDEVVLGTATADDLGVGVGEPVTITALDGSAELTLQVTGTVVSWGDEDVTHAFIVTAPTLQALVCPGVEMERCNLSADVAADVTDDAAGDAARVTLITNGFSEMKPPASVARLGEVGAVPSYLAAFICVLAAAGLLHQLTTTSRRRRHDLAVARALGLPARNAAASLTWQAVLTVIAGTRGRRRGRSGDRTAGVADHRRPTRRADGDAIPGRVHPDRRVGRSSRRHARVARATASGSAAATGRDVEGGMKLDASHRCQRRGARSTDASDQSASGGSDQTGLRGRGTLIVCVAGERNDGCCGRGRTSGDGVGPCLPSPRSSPCPSGSRSPSSPVPSGRARRSTALSSRRGWPTSSCSPAASPAPTSSSASPRIGASLRSTARTPW